MIPLRVHQTASHSLQAQLYDQIRQAILHGCLRPGVAVPSSRELAKELKLSRNTIVLAYEKLAQEGYLLTRSGAGTYVADPLPESCNSVLPVSGKVLEDCSDEFRRSDPRYPPVLLDTGMLKMVRHGPRDHKIDFQYCSTNCRNFPLREWRQLLIDNLSRAGPNISRCAPPEGLLELREAIAAHVAGNRAIPIDADQVIVTVGAQEALNLVSRLFVQPTGRVVIETPCYRGAALVFESYGATLVPASVDEQGLRTEELDGCEATLAYVTPSHQFPTGATMSQARRGELLSWAEKTGAYIVEDDYDSDFRYDGPPLAALAGLNRNNSVIYLGTFSKSVGSGLRTGYIVAPRQLIEPLRCAKSLANCGHPWLEQVVLADFINSGGFARHLRRIRRSYGQTRRALLASMDEHFGSTNISGAEGGMHVMWTLPPHYPTAEEVAAIAAEQGVGVYPIDKSGAVEIGAARSSRCLVLGYTLLSPELARRGIERMASGLRKAGVLASKAEIGDLCTEPVTRIGIEVLTTR